MRVTVKRAAAARRAIRRKDELTSGARFSLRSVRKTSSPPTLWKSLERLSPEHQEVIWQAGRDLALSSARHSIEDLEQTRETLQNEHGVTFHTLSEEDHGKLVEAGQITLDAFLEKGDPAVLEQFKALQAKYSAELAEKGYPWVTN